MGFDRFDEEERVIEDCEVLAPCDPWMELLEDIGVLRRPSKAKRDANRINASKSTGPRTSAGKSISRGNSRKHGFSAKIHVNPVPGENGGFDQVVGDISDSLPELAPGYLARITELCSRWIRYTELELELIKSGSLSALYEIGKLRRYRAQIHNEFRRYLLELESQRKRDVKKSQNR